MNLGNFSFKLGSFTFRPNVQAIILAALGVVGLSISFLLGVGLLLAAVVTSSDHKHRVAAATALVFFALLVSSPLVITIAFAASWFIIRKKIRFAYAISGGLFAVAALLIGHLFSALLFGALGGLLFWLQRSARV